MKLVRDTLSRFVDSGQIAGCAARVIRDGETCFEGCFGYADIERKIKVSDQTIFPIASMTKVITVAGIMRLYEQGLFKLWDPVSEYLPGFKKPTIAVEKPDGGYEIVPYHTSCAEPSIPPIDTWCCPPRWRAAAF